MSRGGRAVSRDGAAPRLGSAAEEAVRIVLRTGSSLPKKKLLVHRLPIATQQHRTSTHRETAFFIGHLASMGYGFPIVL
ncbi:hypothetical protein I4200191B4_08290 [Pseudoflavonifractor gallinarum]